MADSKEKLFSDFPGVSTEAWMEKITADLKGARTVPLCERYKKG